LRDSSCFKGGGESLGLGKRIGRSKSFTHPEAGYCGVAIGRKITEVIAHNCHKQKKHTKTKTKKKKKKNNKKKKLDKKRIKKKYNHHNRGGGGGARGGGGGETLWGV